VEDLPIYAVIKIFPGGIIPGGATVEVREFTGPMLGVEEWALVKWKRSSEEEVFEEVPAWWLEILM
jgi:hypothetical protein